MTKIGSRKCRRQYSSSLCVLYSTHVLWWPFQVWKINHISISHLMARSLKNQLKNSWIEGSIQLLMHGLGTSLLPWRMWQRIVIFFSLLRTGWVNGHCRWLEQFPVPIDIIIVIITIDIVGTAKWQFNGFVCNRVNGSVNAAVDTLRRNKTECVSVMCMNESLATN